MLTKLLPVFSLTIPIFAEDFIQREIPDACKEHLLENVDFFTRTNVAQFIDDWAEERLANFDELYENDQPLSFLDCFDEFALTHRPCINTQIAEKGLTNFWLEEGYFLSYKLRWQFVSMHSDDYFTGEEKEQHMQSLWEENKFMPEDVNFTENEWNMMMSSFEEEGMNGMDEVLLIRDEVWADFGWEQDDTDLNTDDTDATEDDFGNTTDQEDQDIQNEVDNEDDEYDEDLDEDDVYDEDLDKDEDTTETPEEPVTEPESEAPEPETEAPEPETDAPVPEPQPEEKDEDLDAASFGGDNKETESDNTHVLSIFDDENLRGSSSRVISTMSVVFAAYLVL